MPKPAAADCAAAPTPLARSLVYRLYWSHRRTDDLVPGPEGASAHIAFQRMAHHAGLAYLDNVRCLGRRRQ